jgi:hypothetical protein
VPLEIDKIPIGIVTFSLAACVVKIGGFPQEFQRPDDEQLKSKPGESRFAAGGKFTQHRHLAGQFNISGPSNRSRRGVPARRAA